MGAGLKVVAEVTLEGATIQDPRPLSSSTATAPTRSRPCAAATPSRRALRPEVLVRDRSLLRRPSHGPSRHPTQKPDEASPDRTTSKDGKRSGSC
jgi:hypothetical protein